MGKREKLVAMTPLPVMPHRPPRVAISLVLTIMTKRAPDNEGELETKEPEAKRARGDGKGTRPPLFDPAHRYAMWTVMYPDADESEVFLLQLGSAPPEREARLFRDFAARAQRVADGRKNYCPAVLAVWSGQATFQA